MDDLPAIADGAGGKAHAAADIDGIAGDIGNVGGCVDLTIVDRMFRALESASRLLPNTEPWTTALPATLEMLVLI